MPRWYPDEEPRLTLRKWVARRYAEGWTIWDICRERRLPQSTVHRWIRGAEEGRELTDRKKGGRAGRRPGTGREDVVQEVSVMRSSWGWTAEDRAGPRVGPPDRGGQRVRDHAPSEHERALASTAEEARVRAVRAGAFELDVADGLEADRRGAMADGVPGRPLAVRPRGRDRGDADDGGLPRPPRGLRRGVGPTEGGPHGPRRAVRPRAGRDGRLRLTPGGARDQTHPRGP